MKNERDMKNKIKFQYMWEKFLKNEGAVSQVIGTTLMVGMTVILISVAAVAVLGFALPADTPQAKIVIVEAKGDYGPPDFVIHKNSITLRHKGGDALIKNDTKIIITGKGYAYTGTSEGGGSSPPVQDIRVTYKDLTGSNFGEFPLWENLGEIVTGITWDAGETIKLYGSDGAYIGTASQGNTVDSKWMLEAGSEVRVTIIDIPTNEVIATSIITVSQA